MLLGCGLLNSMQKVEASQHRDVQNMLGIQKEEGRTMPITLNARMRNCTLGPRGTTYVTHDKCQSLQCAQLEMQIPQQGLFHTTFFKAIK